MASLDRHRIGSFSAGGRFVSLLDLNPGDSTYAPVRDTFAVKPSATESAIRSQTSRRYGGSRRVAEVHDNGTLELELYIQGTTSDDSMAKLNALLAIAENTTAQFYYEWRPSGQNYSVYYEIRGFQWEPIYRWIEFQSSKTLHVKLALEIAPLAVGDPLDVYDDFAADYLSTDYTFDAGAAYTTVGGGDVDPLGSAYLYYDDQVAADSPALFWRSLTTTTALDVSGNARNGTVLGSPASTVASPVVEPGGDTDTALDLDGVNDRITATGYSPFTNGTPRTYEGMAKVDAHDGGNILFGADSTLGPYFYVYTGGGGLGHVQFLPDANAGVGPIWNNAWPVAGSWVHWALIFDETANTAELFINGVSQGSAAATQAYNAAPGNFQAGASYPAGTASPFDGKIGKIAVYHSALSPARIAAHAASVTSPGGTYTDERRARHTARGYTYLDHQVSLKATPGATITSYKAGVLLRAAAATYLEVYADDNGTNSRLRIDKIVASVRTNLASTNLGARVSNGTAFWLRGRTEGNVVTAEYFTSEPIPAATPATTATYTLSGGDITTFVAGYGGWSWVPQASGSALDNFRIDAYSYGPTTLPGIIDLPSVPGTAPAKVDWYVESVAGFSNTFGLLGWASKPGAGTYPPFGVLEGEAAISDTNATVTANGSARSGSSLNSDNAAEQMVANWYITPSLVTADDFTTSIDVEVWAMMEVSATLGNVTAVLSARAAGNSRRYSNEHGSSGKTLVLPSSGAAIRPFRLGTLSLPTDEPYTWSLGLTLTPATPGAAGAIKLDYLVLVPARQRASSPTGKSPTGYPTMFVSGSGMKVIRSNLAGGWSNGSLYALSPEPGFGGQQLEFPPGNVRAIPWITERIPDDPTSNTGGSTYAGASPSQRFSVWPRYLLTRSS